MLKPMDIHNAEFKRSFKGYNEEEVDSFLAKVVGEYEKLWKDNKRLSDEVEELRGSIKSYQNKEQDIHGLITLTKEMVSEAKAIANQQAQSLVEQARLQAKMITEEAKDQAQKDILSAREEVELAQRRLKELSSKEKSFKERMRQLMETFWAMLEDVSERVPITEKAEENNENTKIYREVAVADEE